VDYIYIQIFFSPKDTIRIANYINKKWNINLTTPKSPGEKKSLRIYVKVSSMIKLRLLVLDHMHPTMLYKLGI